MLVPVGRGFNNWVRNKSIYKFLVKFYRVLPIRLRTDKNSVELKNLNKNGSTANKLVSRPKNGKFHVDPRMSSMVGPGKSDRYEMLLGVRATDPPSEYHRRR